MKTNTSKYIAGAALLLCAAAVSRADTVVTFQVEMTEQIQLGNFTPGVNVVNARGTFNGWGTLQLTNNPSAADPNLYTGAADDTGDANGATLSYKYCIDSGGWESVNNRTLGLPSASGASLALPVVYFNDQPRTDLLVTDSVTFQVDMTEQITLGNFTPGTDSVYVRGNVMGWGSGLLLTNDPAASNPNIYSIVDSETDAPLNEEHYKFYIDRGSAYESPSSINADETGNRFYNLLFTDGDVVLPVVYFSDQPPAPPITNNVTFQVDMSVQAAIGHFDPQSDTVECRGSFNNWTGGAFLLTNNPSGPNVDLFSGTVPIVGSASNTISYKFWDSDVNAGGNGYENPSSTGGGNRTFQLLGTNGSITLAPSLFSDLSSASDFLLEDTLVTFTVNMTNAYTSDTHTAFDPNADSVYINADFLGWPTWSVMLPQLTNNPVGSELYSIQLLIPKGNSVALTYKFSIDGTDNEAGFGQNHLRYVRQGTAYTLPVDTFGNQYSEPSFGELSAGQASGGQVPVSWLGRPGVHLQTKSSLTSGSWQDLLDTDGNTWANGVGSTNGFVSVTNYPASGPATFFRLIKQ